MKTMLLFILLVVASMQSISQCDKKVTWYGMKGEMYDANGGLLDTRQDSIFLETDPQKIKLRFKSDSKELEGTIKDKVCDWKEPFKSGKTVYHATLLIDDQTSDATFTLEAKDGKIILWLEIEIRQERKFKIYLDKFEEVK